MIPTSWATALPPDQVRANAVIRDPAFPSAAFVLRRTRETEVNNEAGPPYYCPPHKRRQSDNGKLGNQDNGTDDCTNRIIIIQMAQREAENQQNDQVQWHRGRYLPSSVHSAISLACNVLEKGESILPTRA